MSIQRQLHRNCGQQVLIHQERSQRSPSNRDLTEAFMSFKFSKFDILQRMLFYNWKTRTSGLLRTEFVKVNVFKAKFSKIAPTGAMHADESFMGSWM